MTPKDNTNRRPTWNKKTTHDLDGWQWNHNLLLSKIAAPDPQTGCQEWLGAQGPYGSLFGAKKNFKNQMTQPRRLLWRALHPEQNLEGMMVAHTCKNTLCMNANHMVVVPHGRNLDWGL